MLKMKLIKRDSGGELLMDGRLDNKSAPDAEKSWWMWRIAVMT